MWKTLKYKGKNHGTLSRKISLFANKIDINILLNNFTVCRYITISNFCFIHWMTIHLFLNCFFIHLPHHINPLNDQPSLNSYGSLIDVYHPKFTCQKKMYFLMQLRTLKVLVYHHS